MDRLTQNTLDSGTTELGFVRTINNNNPDENLAFVKEVEYVDPETEQTVNVNLEGISPQKMKELLDRNQGKVTFKTPGENYNDEIFGVCQIYNGTDSKDFSNFVVEKGKSYRIKLKPTFDDELKNILNTSILEMFEHSDDPDFNDYTYFTSNNALILLEDVDEDNDKAVTFGLNTGITAAVHSQSKIEAYAYITESLNLYVGLETFSEDGWYIADNYVEQELRYFGTTLDKTIELNISGITTMSLSTQIIEYDSYELGLCGKFIESIEEI